MKKRFLMVLLITVLFGAGAFAQEFDLKYYSDYKNDFSGVSSAIYFGSFSDAEEKAEFEQYLDEFTKERSAEKKLTKNNLWLMEKAMNEWDYNQGEVFVVVIGKSKFANSFIVAFVYVDEPDHYLWRAWLLTEEDLKRLM